MHSAGLPVRKLVHKNNFLLTIYIYTFMPNVHFAGSYILPVRRFACWLAMSVAIRNNIVIVPLKSYYTWLCGNRVSMHFIAAMARFVCIGSLPKLFCTYRFSHAVIHQSLQKYAPVYFTGSVVLAGSQVRFGTGTSPVRYDRKARCVFICVQTNDTFCIVEFQDLIGQT